MIPNLLSEVEACKRENPEAWKNAHTGNAHTEDFIRILAPRLHAIDKKFGLNGKRGNPGDISDDVVNYFGEGIGFDPTHGNAPITVIDVIASAGATNASPAWNLLNDPTNPDHLGPGAWVQPTGVTPQPPQPAPVVPGREEALDEMNWLDGYYASHEGLQRPNGLSLNGKPDFEGQAAWYLDVYQQERLKGKNRADARAAYVTKIRHSDEWKAKHPGETP